MSGEKERIEEKNADLRKKLRTLQEPDREKGAGWRRGGWATDDLLRLEVPPQSA